MSLTNMFKSLSKSTVSLIKSLKHLRPHDHFHTKNHLIDVLSTEFLADRNIPVHILVKNLLNFYIEFL